MAKISARGATELGKWKNEQGIQLLLRSDGKVLKKYPKVSKFDQPRWTVAGAIPKDVKKDEWVEWMERYASKRGYEKVS